MFAMQSIVNKIIYLSYDTGCIDTTGVNGHYKAKWIQFGFVITTNMRRQ